MKIGLSLLVVAVAAGIIFLLGKGVNNFQNQAKNARSMGEGYTADKYEKTASALMVMIAVVVIGSILFIVAIFSA